MKCWRRERVLELVQKRLDAIPDARAVRRATVEHVFGAPKVWMGATPFPRKGLGNARTDMSPAILAFDRKRKIRLFGTAKLVEAIRA